MVELATTIWADGPSSTPYEPQKHQIRSWGTWIEQIITAFTSNGTGLVFSTLDLLNTRLEYGRNTMAWVIADPIAANNGVYRKVDVSGTGSWVRMADLPFSFIIASDAGAGTPNAIVATTSIPVSGSALVWIQLSATNTGSPVTVSFNGDSPLTIKTNSGGNPVAGGLVSGSIVLGIVSGATFRLVSDQASTAIVAAAEAAADRAEAAAAIAGNGYIFPELMPSWNPADAGPAIEEASNISASSGGEVKLLAGRTYPVSKVAFAAASTLSAFGAILAVAGTLTGANIDVTLGSFMKFDELVVQSPGTELNTDIVQVGIGVRGTYLEVRATAQRAGGGILVNPQDVDIAYVKTKKIDRPLHLLNTGTSAQTTGTRIGFLDVEDYVRAFRATFTEFDLGGLWAVGRSPNASKSPGHNGWLIVGCRNWSIGDWWVEDAGEHAGRIGGSDGIWGVTANFSIGNGTVIRSGGCALKINPTLKVTAAGTVAVTSGSPTITGTGTAFLTALKRGSNVRISDTGEIYRIASIASNTVATLDRNVTTADSSSALEIAEAAWNGQIGNIVGIDVGDPADAGNEELVRLTHVRGLKVGTSVAFRDGAQVSAQYLVQVNDIDDVEIAGLGGTGVVNGFLNIDGTSDINVGEFGGDVTNLRLPRVFGACNGNNAIGVNTAFRVGKVSVGLEDATGWLVNLLRWDGGTLSDVVEITGRVTGSIGPVYQGIPNSDLFLHEIAWGNSKSIGRGSGSRPGTSALEILAGVFSSANQGPTGFFINGARATAGSGNFGAGIEFSRLGSSRRGAAIAPRQGSADDKEVGLSVFVQDSNATTNEALIESARFDHFGHMWLLNPASGVILTSPDGALKRRLTIDNAGTAVWATVT